MWELDVVLKPFRYARGYHRRHDTGVRIWSRTKTVGQTQCLRVETDTDAARMDVLSYRDQSIDVTDEAVFKCATRDTSAIAAV